MSPSPRKRGRTPKVEPYGRSWTFRLSGERHTFGTQREAEIELHRLLGERLAGRDAEREGIPFPLACERWMETKLSASLDVRNSWQRIIDNHLLPWFGRADLGELSRADVEEYARRKLGRYGKGEGSLPVREGSQAKIILSAQSVTHQLFILRGVFALAESETEGRIRNVVADVERVSIDAKEPEPVERDDVLGILDLVPASERPLTQVLLHLGLRLSEALGLGLSDYDPETGILRVRRQLKRGDNGKMARGKMKTKASEDDLLLSPGLALVMNEHVERLAASGVPNPMRLLFPSTGARHGYISASNYRNRIWNPAVAAWQLQSLRSADQARAIASLAPERRMVGWLLTLPGMSVRMALDARWEQLDDQGLRLTAADGTERLVPVSAKMRRRLDAHRQETEGVANKHGLICPGRKSRGHRAEDVTHELRRALRSVGAEDLPSPHRLRHTFISLLIAQGGDLVTVSKAARHARRSTTADRYAHAFRRAGLVALDTFDLYEDDEQKAS